MMVNDTILASFRIRGIWVMHDNVPGPSQSATKLIRLLKMKDRNSSSERLTIAAQSAEEGRQEVLCERSVRIDLWVTHLRMRAILPYRACCRYTRSLKSHLTARQHCRKSKPN